MDLDAMRRAAEAAHPEDEWRRAHSASSYIDIVGPGKPHRACQSGELAHIPVCRVHVHTRGQAHADHILAWHPAACLKVLDRLTKMRSALSRVMQAGHDLEMYEIAKTALEEFK